MALVIGAQEALHLKSLLGELGRDVKIVLETDASAAIAAAEKRGLLRFFHLSILWLFLKAVA